MADVIAIIMLADVIPMICGRSYCNLIMLIVWQMEGHSVDVMTTCIRWMADVIAIAADGITI